MLSGMTWLSCLAALWCAINFIQPQPCGPSKSSLPLARGQAALRTALVKVEHLTASRAQVATMRGHPDPAKREAGVHVAAQVLNCIGLRLEAYERFLATRHPSRLLIQSS